MERLDYSAALLRSRTLPQVLHDHGHDGDAQHAIPGVCLVEVPPKDLLHALACPEGRTVIHCERIDGRWFVVGMVLEDLLPLIPAWYGDDPDDGGAA